MKKLGMKVALVLTIVFVAVANVSTKAEAKTKKPDGIIGATYKADGEHDWINVFSTYETTVGTKIGELDLDKKYKVYEVKNGFGRIKFDGKRAWVKLNNLELCKNGWVRYGKREWHYKRVGKKDLTVKY